MIKIESHDLAPIITALAALVGAVMAPLLNWLTTKNQTKKLTAHSDQNAREIRNDVQSMTGTFKALKPDPPDDGK